MRTYAQKPRLQHPHRDVRSIREPQRPVGHRAVQRAFGADSETDGVELRSTAVAGPPRAEPRSRRPFDFGQVSLLAETSDGFQDNEPESPAAAESPLVSAPTATRVSCLQLVSFTVVTRAPRVSNASGSCRLELGHCPTPRGSCGAGAESGATFTAVVRAGTGCSGELRFAQNVTSSERRRTPTGGSEECLSARGAHNDGVFPWKGCTRAVTASGDHSITSDDCPNIRLAGRDAAQASDRFKTFLLWKAAGGTTSIPIACAQWRWQASTRRTGTSGTCASDWSAPGGAGATFRGAASRDAPVRTPHIRSVRYAPCARARGRRSER